MSAPPIPKHSSFLNKIVSNDSNLMYNLREIYLQDNHFTGIIPSSLCNLPYLYSLSIQNQVRDFQSNGIICYAECLTSLRYFSARRLLHDVVKDDYNSDKKVNSCPQSKHLLYVCVIISF